MKPGEHAIDDDLLGEAAVPAAQTPFAKRAKSISRIQLISIEPNAGANTKSRSHFLGALLQIGTDQGHEHGTEGKSPCPRLLGQSAQVAAGAID